MEGKNHPEEHIEGQEYERYVHIKMNRNTTRKMCPFVLERLFAETFKSKRNEIASVTDGYIIKVNNSEELTRTSTKIQDIECEATDKGPALRMYNSSKGLIYENE